MNNFLDKEENEKENENETENETEEEEKEKEKEKENENETENEKENEKEIEVENEKSFPSQKNGKRTKKRKRKKKRTKRNRILGVEHLKPYSSGSSLYDNNEKSFSKIQIENGVTMKRENSLEINEQENEIVNELTKLEQKINFLLTETGPNELRNGLEDEEGEGRVFQNHEKDIENNEIKLDDLKMINVNNFELQNVGNQDLGMDQNATNYQDFSYINRATIENIENLDDDLDGNNGENNNNNNNNNLENRIAFQYVHEELPTDCKVSFNFLVILWFLSTIVLAGCLYKIRHLDNCHSGKVLLLVATSCVLVQNAISFITLTIYYSLNYDISTMI